jgi:DNA-damage-inducible protein J
MATKTGYLNARIEPRLKRDAEKILGKLGLTSAAAVTMFYRQVTLRQGLPFDVCLPNKDTVAAMDELDRGGGRTHRGTGREVINSILHE